MLDLYYHLHDDESQKAMMELAQASDNENDQVDENSLPEGNLRENDKSKIEKTLHVPEVRELVASLSNITERAGFEPAVPAKGTPVFETGSISHSDTSP